MAPRECERRQCEKEEAGQPSGDSYNCPHGPARRYADNPGVGHRVAEQSLHRRPGHCQGGANKSPTRILGSLICSTTSCSVRANSENRG